MIEVQFQQDLAALSLAAAERLNASSRNTSLFSSPAWLTHFLGHDPQLRVDGSTPWFLGAWEGGALKGYLPLKRAEGGRVVQPLIGFEVERPRVVAAPEDEGRVAQAFLRALLHRADEWELLEFFQQDESSPLFHGPQELSSRHWLRSLPDRENNVLPLRFAALTDYAASLSRNMRHSTRKQLKALLGSPSLQLVTARTPQARLALFEVFLEIEQRSWKARAQATVGEREQTYRAALEDPSLDAVTCVASLEGVPIAGSIWVHYGRKTFHLQSVYAESHEALSPGALMMWVTIGDAIDRRSAAYDPLPDFSHYKARWGAQTIDTRRVQIFRVGSRRHLRALAGDLLRKVAPPAPAPFFEGKNPFKVAAGSPGAHKPAELTRLAGLLDAARAAGALEHDAAALSARNPFS